MHYAVSGSTVAEIIYNRADASKEHMGLTNWTDAPDGKIMKSDVAITNLDKNDLKIDGVILNFVFYML